MTVPVTKRLGVSISVFAVALLASPIGPVGAQTQCSAVDPLGTRCSVTDETKHSAPTPGTTTVRSQAPPGPRYVWVNTSIRCEAETADQWSQVNSISNSLRSISSIYRTSEAIVPGEVWVGELVDPRLGGTDAGYIGCVADGTSGPPKPPPLPTAEQIWGEALTYVPPINLDPKVRGLTGMETRMWYSGPTSDSVDLTLNGYWIRAEIRAVGFGWDMGGANLDGSTTQYSTAAGSPDSPAATHTYTAASNVRIIHEVTWVGNATMGGPGIPGAVDIDLGQAVLATARDYEVIQVRTPLVPGG